MRRPVAVVTGGNRGLGRETCRQLGARGWAVLLASRRAEEGERAAEELSEQGLAVAWRPLDVADPASIAAFADGLTAERIAVDALVNNAGVYPQGAHPASAHRTMEVNFLGPLRLTDALAPLLGRGASVVMVSSGMGELHGLPPEIRSRFEQPLSREELVRLEEELAGTLDRGEHHGDGSLPYRVTKCGLNVLTRLLAKELAAHGVRVNAVCPGWVRTDMGGAGAPREVEEGASGIVWGATLPPDGPSGGFFRDGRPIAW